MARKRNSANEAKTLERRIFFYRVDAGRTDAGKEVCYDCTASLGHVGGLTFDTEGNYWRQANGDDICLVVDRKTCPQRIRLGNIRRSGFPQTENGGKVSPLKLAENAGLVEYTHIVVLGNNIIGAEFNFYGPRVSRLQSYLNLKAKDHGPRIRINQLIRGDIAEQLKRLKDVRMLDLKIEKSQIEAINQADKHLGAAFNAAATLSDAQEIELVLKPKPRSDKALSPGLLSFVQKFGASKSVRDQAERFYTKGLDPQTNAVEFIDVLSDQLIAKKAIRCLDDRTRALDPESAFAAIEQAYSELKPQLLSAAMVIA